MKTKLIIIVSIILLSITACSAAPKWVSNPRSVLDYEEYIIGIGSGSSYQAALTNAQTDLAQQISVKVESVLELKSVNLEIGGKEFYAESIEKSSKLTVDQMLKGITVARQEQEKQTYWVMVTLNKTRMLNSIRGELDALYRSAETLFEDGNRMAMDGRILSAIKNYMDAQAILPEFYTKKAFYDNFASNPYPVTGNLTISSLESGIRNMMSSIVFEVISGDKQSASNGSQLPEQVVFRAVYRSRSGDRIPLSGFPVKVSYGDNTLLDKGQTDNQGQYRVNVIAIPQSGTRGKVMIRSDAFMLPSYMSKSAEQSVAEVFYTTTESEAIVVVLEIKDEKGNRLDRVERNVAKTLSANNVRVSEKAPLIMNGVVSTTESKEVEGIGSPKILAKVRLDLQFGIANTKEILGTVSGSGQGISERGSTDAISRAQDNISINNRELAQMLSNASGRISSAQASSQNVPQRTVTEQPVQVSQPKPVNDEQVSLTKDRHWFTTQDRLYVLEEFTTRTSSLWARVGRFISESGSGFNIKASIMDYEKELNMTAEYYYKTVPGEINNIKKDDIVFVFHTTKTPENEKQSKTQQWEMVRVTDTKELLNGRIYVSSYKWAQVEAVRVIIP